MSASHAETREGMRGIRFILDDAGKQTAVVIDLRRNRSLWEDFYDRALADSRRREPRESLELVRKRLARRDRRAARG